MTNVERIHRDVIGIGASAGGLQALLALLPALATDRAAVAVVLHRHPTAPSFLVELLSAKSSLPVEEPANGALFRAGRVYVAPRDHHMTVRRGRIVLDRSPKLHHSRPAIDRLFQSLAQEYEERVVGVLLSGTLSDGVQGLVAIKAMGGISLTQDPGEATHPSMPLRALAEDDVDRALAARDLGHAMTLLAEGEEI